MSGQVVMFDRGMDEMLLVGSSINNSFRPKKELMVPRKDY